MDNREPHFTQAEAMYEALLNIEHALLQMTKTGQQPDVSSIEKVWTIAKAALEEINNVPESDLMDKQQPGDLQAMLVAYLEKRIKETQVIINAHQSNHPYYLKEFTFREILEFLIERMNSRDIQS
jgi:hypothetical protein